MNQLTIEEQQLIAGVRAIASQIANQIKGMKDIEATKASSRLIEQLGSQFAESYEPELRDAIKATLHHNLLMGSFVDSKH